MAGPERIMAENTPGTTETTSPTALSATPRELPLYRAANFDPNRKDYQTRITDTYVSWFDPITGVEVARTPRLEGGTAVPETEELNPIGKDPDRVVDILLTIDNMEAGERGKEVWRERYQQAGYVLQEYAHKSKLLGLHKEVIKKERQFRDFDQAEIQRQPEDRRETVQGLLDKLDATEEEFNRIDSTLKDDQYKGLFSGKEWEKLRETIGRLEQDKANFKQQIISMTSSDFIGRRMEWKEDIRKAKAQFEREEREKRETKITEQRAEPQGWVVGLEQLLLQDVAPDIISPDKATFSEQLGYFSEQQALSATGEPNNLDLAKEGLSWHFHQARGVFADLEERLEHKYREWANSLLPNREVSQLDILTDSQGRITQKTFDEVQDEVIKYFDTLLDTSSPQYVEHAARWNYLQRRGINPQTIQALQGIRVELVRRAQGQIEDSLLNLDRELKGQRTTTLPARISGEWSVHRVEREITERRERQDLERGSEPLFREESYYRIRLLGNTRQLIELGVDQAADNIIQSATTFDLSAMQQRMEMLLKAIREKSTDLQRSERISKSEADAIIEQVEDSATNKIDFYILDWAGQNLQGDLFSSYLENRMRVRGAEKLRQMPAMIDGKVGIALLHLLSERYRLYHRPQGFKGQLFDDDTTHKFLRSQIRSKIINSLMEHELKGETDQERNRNRENLTKVSTADQFLSNFKLKDKLIGGKEFKDLTEEERNNVIERLKSFTPEQMEQWFRDLTPGLRVEIRRWHLKQILKRIKQEYLNGKEFKDLTEEERNNVIERLKSFTPEQKETTLQVLRDLRRVRGELAKEQSEYQEAERKTTSAFTIANQVMNIFGESAELGAPSIRMDKGDYISVCDLVLFYKYAILTDSKEHEQVEVNGSRMYLANTQAFIRWRRRIWIVCWRKAGLDRQKANVLFQASVQKEYSRVGIPSQFNRPLQAGFEETGLTDKQWQAFERAVREIRVNGYLAEIGGVKFEEIVRRDDLQPVMNNFLADYKSSESQINNEVILEQVAKGRLVMIEKILKRLGLTSRQGIEGNTTQQRIDKLTQMIEDSRSFDAELERLAYFEATHGLPQQGQGSRYLPFSADRIDYGFQGMSWLLKRIHHLKAFWYTNLRRTVPRAVDLIHAMPFSLRKLAREMDFDTIFDLAININTGANGMESVDNPALVQFAQRHKAMGTIRGRSEGGISDQEWKKVWGFWEKPLVDANSLWRLFPDTDAHPLAFVKDIKLLHADRKESIINHLQETTFSRFVPILVATEKALGEDRQALSSGAGYEENQKFALRFLEWLMSRKPDDVGREQGGLLVQQEIEPIIRLIVTPNSYREGNSLWDEFWRKQTPSHNPRLPIDVPPTIYIRA